MNPEVREDEKRIHRISLENVFEQRFNALLRTMFHLPSQYCLLRLDVVSLPIRAVFVVVKSLITDCPLLVCERVGRFDYHSAAGTHCTHRQAADWY